MQKRQHASILIVEDHGTMRMALLNTLQQAFPDCHVRAAASGEEGVAAA